MKNMMTPAIIIQHVLIAVAMTLASVDSCIAFKYILLLLKVLIVLFSL